MKLTTRQRLYRTLPVPVLQQVLPRIAPYETPFREHVLAREVIFIHVPKAAGTSLKTEIYGKAAGGHRRIVEFYVYDKKKAEAFFKCAFVRNPWDRMLSAWSYLVQGNGTSRNDQLFAADVLRTKPDFASFVHGLLDPEFREFVMVYGHFRPQAHWICMPGRKEPAVDFLGRFENIDEDVPRLRTALGIVALGGAPLGAAGEARPVARLLRARPSKHVAYRESYDEETRAIVADLYAQDIAMLGYSF